MPFPQDVLNEIGRQREAAERLANRDSSRSWLKTLGLCWMWSLIGLYGIAWSFHLTDGLYARAAFWAGLSVGNAGMLYTLIAAWRAAERRGDS